MTTFTATFSNGKTITRNNKTGRTYTHAWATLSKCGSVLQAGFSSSREAAERSAKAYLKFTYHVGYEVVEAVAA